mgnify:CR=1 FL=1
MLSAIGLDSPKPCDDNLNSSTPFATKYSFTDRALASDNLWFNLLERTRAVGPSTVNLSAGYLFKIAIISAKTCLDSSLIEDLPVSNDIDILINTQDNEVNKTIFIDQECQTVNEYNVLLTKFTQTSPISLNDRASQSSIITVENQYIQTEQYSNLYSSILFEFIIVINKKTNIYCHLSTHHLPRRISQV